MRTSTVPVEMPTSTPARDESTSIERYDGFTIGIVELDDQGRFWNRDQVAAVESEIVRRGREAEDTGVGMVVFVHGWRHDAAECDKHLACFRELVRRIAEDQRRSKTRPHPIIGIYVAWRGYSSQRWPFEILSFVDRKNAATRIGSGDVTELLARIDRLHRDLNASRKDPSELVVIGHSLGGTIVFEALASIFKARLAGVWPGVDEDGMSRVISGFGDLVLLVNPAFEAERWRSIHDLTSTYISFSKHQRPLLVVAESETDSATKRWFPIGQWSGTLFEKTRDSEQRDALFTAIGNYGPFVTHHLERADHSEEHAPEIRVRDCVCQMPELLPADDLPNVIGTALPGSDRDEGWGTQRCVPERRLGPLLLTCDQKVQRGNPFWVVRVAPNVLHEHNGFFSPYFLAFVRRLLFDTTPQ